MNLASTWPSTRSTTARWVIGVLPWLLVVALFVSITIHLGRADLLRMVQDGGRASAVVTAVEGDVIDVSYRNDQVGVVSAELTTDASIGDVVDIVYDRDNPFRVRLVSESIRSEMTWLVVGIAALIAVFTLAAMQWSASRVRTLAAQSTPAFRMQAIIHARPWMRVPQLSLFALDADFGDRCVCTVRLADLHAEVNEYDSIDVDVKGFPRPAGRVVVRHRDTTLWPRGRALVTTRYRWPFQTGATPASTTNAIVERARYPNSSWPDFDPPDPIILSAMRPRPQRPRPDHRLWALVAATTIGVAATIAITVITVINGRAVDHWMREGQDAIAVVADRPDRTSGLAVDVSIEGTNELIPMMAPVEFPDRYDTGDTYPAVVSQSGTEVRLRTEPYDRWTPRLWILLPTLLAGWFLLRRAFKV